MHIHHETTDENARLSILEGELIDQAALFGVLNSLYGLGFPILSVEATPTTEDYSKHDSDVTPA